jgi:hypothetical protein
VVEALSSELARRWCALEGVKRSITQPAQLIQLGAEQDAVIEAFMHACDRGDRRDLAGFILDAAAPLLERGVPPIPMSLDPTAPLSLRMAARNSAGSLLRGVATWARWDQQHRGVRFIDDNYAAAQHLLGRFERIGRAGADRAAQWLGELAALAPTTAPTAGPGSDNIDGP